MYEIIIDDSLGHILSQILLQYANLRYTLGNNQFLQQFDEIENSKLEGVNESSHTLQASFHQFQQNHTLLVHRGCTDYMMSII